MIRLNKKHILFGIAVVAVVVGVTLCGDNYGSKTDNTPLKFAISRGVAGYFIISGESYGYATDIADTLARSRGRMLELFNSVPVSDIKAGFADGSYDMAAVLESDRAQLRGYPAQHFYNTWYVILGPSSGKTNRNPDLGELCKGKRLLVNQGFARTLSYGRVQRKCLTANISEVDMNGIDMAAELLAGRCDLFVCEKSEAEMIKYMYRGIKEYYVFDQRIGVDLVYARYYTRHRFAGALSRFKRSDDYEALAELYFGATAAKQFSKLRIRPVHFSKSISRWDEQIKRISTEEGVDWRLMSAIAFFESRFRNDAVSPRGAVGLMQVTPIVADEFDMDPNDLSDPETNIRLAAKLLRKSSRTLGYGNFPKTTDRMAVVVASYHCGITRIMEAQRLVVESGGDKDSWDDMQTMMTKMNDPEFVASNPVRGGQFRDAAASIAYVRRVMDKYDSYRQSVKL